jgi:hypothetical protein
VIPALHPALRRRRSVLATLVLSVALAACGPDPFAPRATSSNIDTTVEVWALTGSPINYPTALLVPQRFAVRPDPSATFDLGFDIDADGKLQVLPVSKVVTPLGGSRNIGFFKPTIGYDLVTEAPRSGWTFDETQTYEVGDVFVVAVTTQYCAFDVSNEVYAKYRVDSIFPAERRIRLSGRVNPNCGFRSFADGIPEF